MAQLNSWHPGWCAGMCNFDSYLSVSKLCRFQHFDPETKLIVAYLCIWHFRSLLYLFISAKHSTDKVSSAEAEVLSEGKHVVQTPACAARVLFYTGHRLQCQEQWQCVEELMQEKEKNRLGVSDSVFNAAFQWIGFYFHKDAFF